MQKSKKYYIIDHKRRGGGNVKMHRFLRTIGFSELKTKKQLDELIKNIILHSDVEKIAIDSDGSEFVEITKMFQESFGITVCGQYAEDNKFSMEYYYPVFIGREISTNEQIEIERHVGTESYAGICDEMRLGVTLIFYLQNVADYLNQKLSFDSHFQNVTTALSALALNGKIILPIGKNEEQIRNTEKNKMNHNYLMAAARDGDEEAIESLTLEDIDLYSMISKRVEKEDIFSIVESYFMPYGIESDQYSIMGTILDIKETKNRFTEEKVLLMKVNSNDLIFDLCINEKDLIGVPDVGRRFKGNIWMQGKINFLE